jgi:MarR family transcriptional regulator, organic hydroperoxide resistance regulator
MNTINMYTIWMSEKDGEARPLTGSFIWRLALKWRVAVDRALAPIDLTHAQYVFLASLYGLSRQGKRPSQRALAEFSGLEPMYISKLARALEQAGFLMREPNSADPRAFHLTLTNRGEEIMQVAFARVSELHDLLLAPLGERGDPRRVEFRQTLDLLLRHVDGLDWSVDERKE